LAGFAGRLYRPPFDTRRDLVTTWRLRSPSGVGAETVQNVNAIILASEQPSPSVADAKSPSTE
jgi:hypothetical protein